uniref:AIG1-type G domain-containing protein n=1 Tax=Sinocyclocheilus rhinocerous TaxID=307959 RepID=A0A673IW74_9TELE
MLGRFSEEAVKRSIVITTDEEAKANEFIQRLTAECGGHLQLDHEIKRPFSGISQQLEKILRENNEEFLTCDIFDDAEETLVDEDQSRSEMQEEDSDDDSDKMGKILCHSPLKSLSNTEQGPEYDRLKGSINVTRKLILVVCGFNETLKKSISKCLRGKKKFFPSLHQKEKVKDCVKKEGKIHGRKISLVELPALTRLSEEEVMRQTLNCVSLCDPGVHVFLLIVPDAPLTDEEKAEMEEIQRRFSLRINKHLMIIIIQDKNMTTPVNLVPSSATETSIQTFGNRQFVLENNSQVPALLQEVENMIKMNNESLYMTFMYLQACVELERSKHRAEIEELRRSMMKTAGLTHCVDDLRIVLLGKTGAGKSATGNTILRRKAFKSTIASRSLTRECEKKTSEFNRRRITVMDTPGLFDTGVDNVETRKEVVKCVSMAAPGPHVFLLVIPLVRFTQEEKDAVKMIQDMFGDKSRMYTMVLFTRGDDLEETTIDEFIEENYILKNIIHQCGKRYHVFNNKDTKDQMQVSELLDKIDCMVAANGRSFYTNEMFQQVEKNIREEQERIMKEREEEIKRKEEELRAKYEAEIEEIKKENERERQEMLNELRKSEDEFKKREEEIKKERDENQRKELQRKLEEKQNKFEEENKRKENALAEQQNFIKYLEEKHEKEKQKLREKIQHETREQAENEFGEKLNKEVAKALQEYEEAILSRGKQAHGWSQHGGSFGAAAEIIVSSFEDVVNLIIRLHHKHQAQK